jgi:alpha-mannosidase
VILSALKKADNDTGIVARFYEVEGSAAEAPITFLGRSQSWRNVNLLEEPQGQASNAAAIHIKPFEIKTVLLPPNQQ